MGCVFCEISKKEKPAYIIYEDDDIMTILDINPISKGHLLVIPKEHHEGIQDTPVKTLIKAWVTASAFAKIYRVNLNAPGVNVVTNSGSPAGQVIFHFHVHVIPRWDQDGFKKSGRHQLNEKEANEVINMLSNHIDVVKDYLKQL
ncbi:HIT family hydrolase, diadenosine tetraphosphate hydrolase [Caldisphaera lagunensis DSM 15908]|uniref:HIT family hydrolase, diadenosine tetraphosphate hydrolase n=1 Tax=Caldisphaera lagunensis (strain DSM 15908 / JCM 11604 / ANMR 0165 / IC-154) TaxID=1056495 RepID=L0A9J5_CALLD|nr:HIT domain-containing protein [Caldisphaera lagunensis]AFZ70541.1 HIT family hydrolase, diadenosine tetraphosphate hydrolase [Caldisphaera lagunensis DSM 15908]